MSSKIISKLSQFTTCEIADSLSKLGISHANYIPDLHAIPGQIIDKTIVGPAYTVKMVLSSDPAPTLDKHFIDTVPSESIVVITSPKSVKSASLGGLLAVAVSQRGAKGVVIDGRCRDLAELRDSGLPIFSRGHSVLGQSPFTKPVAVNVPIQIDPEFPAGVQGSFPSVVVNPNDYVVADENGIVIVPKSLEDAVVEKALTGRTIDDKCMQDLKAGKGVKETFALHRGQKKK